MGSVTRNEVSVYVGCITKMGETKSSYWQNYAVYPLIMERPDQGSAQQTIKCQQCGRELTLNIKSEQKRKIVGLTILIGGLFIFGLISAIGSATGWQGLGCIGAPFLLVGLYVGYETFLKRVVPTDIMQLGTDSAGHKLFDKAPSPFR